jgi:hypothetical protein
MWGRRNNHLDSVSSSPNFLLGTLRVVEDKLVVNVEIGTLTILVRS